MEGELGPAAASTHNGFAQAARAIVSADQVRAAGASDTVCGVVPQLIVEPSDEQQLAAILKLANNEGLGVIPRGGGTKRGWGRPPERAEVVLSTARLNRVIEHAWADLTVTVEAGCRIGRLQRTLAEHGQRLALDPLWPDRATVGGVLSTNDSGVLRLRFGGLRDLIIGVTLALPDGTLAKSGGKVVKNVAGYDLPKLATGALGTLGVITRAVFRLHPLPKERRTFSCAAGELREAQRLLLAIQDSQLAHSALQLRFGTDGPACLDVLFEGIEAGLAAQEERLRAILGSSRVNEVAEEPGTPLGAAVWGTRQLLYDAAKNNEALSAVAKISMPPADIADRFESLPKGFERSVRYSAVVQGTGVGCVQMEGDPETLAGWLKCLQLELESHEGAFSVPQPPMSRSTTSVWGTPGDSLSLMRSTKQQFDPKGTLNPGRFLGGL